MTKNNSKVQALYDHCNNTFTPSSTSPSPQASQSICSLLGISQFLSFLLIAFSFMCKLKKICALAMFGSVEEMGIGHM